MMCGAETLRGEKVRKTMTCGFLKQERSVSPALDDVETLRRANAYRLKEKKRRIFQRLDHAYAQRLRQLQQVIADLRDENANEKREAEMRLKAIQALDVSDPVKPQIAAFVQMATTSINFLRELWLC